MNPKVARVGVVSVVALFLLGLLFRFSGSDPREPDSLDSKPTLAAAASANLMQEEAADVESSPRDSLNATAVSAAQPVALSPIRQAKEVIALPCLESIESWIAKLATLAVSPNFHREATPLWRGLREATRQAMERCPSEVWDRLQGLWENEKENSKLRAAVFFACAPWQEESMFWSVFLAWTNGRDRDPELARAAVLAGQDRAATVTRQAAQEDCHIAVPIFRFMSLLQNRFQVFETNFESPLATEHTKQILSLLGSSPLPADETRQDLLAADRAFTEQIFLLALGPALPHNTAVQSVVRQGLRARSPAETGYFWKPASIFLASAARKCVPDIAKELDSQIEKNTVDGPWNGFAKQALEALADPSDPSLQASWLTLVEKKPGENDGHAQIERLVTISGLPGQWTAMNGTDREKFVTVLSKLALDAQDDASARGLAMEVLSLSKDETMIYYTAEQLLVHDADPQLRAKGAHAMLLLGPKWIPAAHDLCRQRFAEEKMPLPRIALLRVLAAWGSPGINELLEQIAKSSKEDPSVREAAKGMLGK